MTVRNGGKNDGADGSSGSEGGGAEQVVDVLLAQAGLRSVPEVERQRLAGLYPGVRRTADRFYEVDTGDEVTAAVFAAELPNGEGTTDDR